MRKKKGKLRYLADKNTQLQYNVMRTLMIRFINKKMWKNKGEERVNTLLSDLRNECILKGIIAPLHQCKMGRKTINSN